MQTTLQKYEFEGDTQVIKALIQQLQKLVPTRRIESVKERETIIKEKETVLVQYGYCKTLMPQTSTYCPNCGGKRLKFNLTCNQVVLNSLVLPEPCIRGIY